MPNEGNHSPALFLRDERSAGTFQAVERAGHALTLADIQRAMDKCLMSPPKTWAPPKGAVNLRHHMRGAILTASGSSFGQDAITGHPVKVGMAMACVKYAGTTERQCLDELKEKLSVFDDITPDDMAKGPRYA